MPRFDYNGFDRQGRRVSGHIDGAGRKAVTLLLREQGIFTTRVSESSVKSARLGPRDLLTRWQQSAAELASATRQCGTLLSAGLSLDSALETVADQMGNTLLARTLAEVREELVQGHSFHQALANHPATFPDLYVSMVHVGENSGTLDQTLHQLSDFLESQARTRARIRAALAYPLLMTLVGSGVLFFLFVFVMPKITRMLLDMDMALPLPTLLLINLAGLVFNWWWLGMILMAVAGYLFHRYRLTPAGRTSTDRLLLRLPLSGRLLLQISTSRFARTLGTLLQSGVPLLKALDIARSLLANSILKSAVDRARSSVQEGGSLARSLRDSAVFPPMLAQVVAAGEQSGQLEDMLFRVADTYEHQAELSITGLLSLLEPLMILFMGGIVGFAVLAVLLPIFQASQGFG